MAVENWLKTSGKKNVKLSYVTSVRYWNYKDKLIFFHRHYVKFNFIFKYKNNAMEVIDFEFSKFIFMFNLPNFH